MEQEKLTELLDKYFGGNTSEEEELLLKELLDRSSLPGALKDEYGYISAPPAGIPDPSEGFEARLAEITYKSAAVNPSNSGRKWLTEGTHSAQSLNHAIKAGRLLKLTGAVAAMAAGIWIITMVLREPLARDTYSDPAIAMAEVKTILLNVSEKMNTGTSRLRQVGDFTERADELEGLTTINEVVGKNLSRLRYLDDLSPAKNENETN